MWKAAFEKKEGEHQEGEVIIAESLRLSTWPFWRGFNSKLYLETIFSIVGFQHFIVLKRYLHNLRHNLEVKPVQANEVKQAITQAKSCLEYYLLLLHT